MFSYNMPVLIFTQLFSPFQQCKPLQKSDLFNPEYLFHFFLSMVPFKQRTFHAKKDVFPRGAIGMSHKRLCFKC